MIAYSLLIALQAIILLTLPPLPALGDVIYFKGIDRGINAKVFELENENVSATISKEDVLSMNYSMGDKEGYPDTISIAGINNKRNIQCKVEEFTDQTLLLRIPKDEIASVNVSFNNDSRQNKRRPAAEAAEDTSASAFQASQSLEKLKDQIKMELREEIKDEQEAEEELVRQQTLGTVEGKIVERSKPLPGCKVKIVLLSGKGSSLTGYRPDENVPPLETVTDREGRYTFRNVPAGQYKLYWMPPREDSWVRRIQMEPDVLVVEGEMARPKDVNAGIQTVN